MSLVATFIQRKQIYSDTTTQTDTHTPIKYLALTLPPVITLTDPRGIVTAARVGTISTTQTELTVRVIVEAR